MDRVIKVITTCKYSRKGNIYQGDFLSDCRFYFKLGCLGVLLLLSKFHLQFTLSNALSLYFLERNAFSKSYGDFSHLPTTTQDIYTHQHPLEISANKPFLTQFPRAAPCNYTTCFLVSYSSSHQCL